MPVRVLGVEWATDEVSGIMLAARGNTLLTPQIITREALRMLENNLIFARSVNASYEAHFGNRQGVLRWA